MAFMSVSNVLQSMQAVAQRMVLGDRPGDRPKPDLINRLPAEMLDKIFQCVMIPPKERTQPDSKTTSYTPIFSESLQITPFPLTQVCRRWRHIAQNTGELWRSITILRPSKRHIHRVDLWMRFASHGPLDINFVQKEPESMDDLEAAGEIIDLLSFRYKQWSEVKFHLHQDIFPPSLAANFKLISTILWPTLKVATISNSYKFTSSEEAVAGTWESLNRIPSLRTLNWLSADVLSRPTAYQLQSLTITAITSRELIQGVKACVSLRELEARVESGNSLYDAELRHLEPYLHNHLQHIALTGDSRDLQAFMHSFTLPRLISVDLDHLDDTAWDFLWVLLYRSSASLTRLILQVYGVTGDMLAHCFEWPSIASLETLSISGAMVTDAALHKLTVFPVIEQRPFYFQNLKHLTLTVCSAQMDEDIFIRMLASRLFTPCDQPDKVELMIAAFIVQNKTSKMRMYEDMCNQIIGGKFKENVDPRGWNNRTVDIRQQ